jgi:cyclic beta-1,2-glucan synthetase
LRKEGSNLVIDPCIPREWRRYEINYRYGSTRYRIEVGNPDSVCRGVASVSLDGVLLEGDGRIPLSDDGGKHYVRVVLG